MAMHNAFCDCNLCRMPTRPLLLTTATGLIAGRVFPLLPQRPAGFKPGPLTVQPLDPACEVVLLPPGVDPTQPQWTMSEKIQRDDKVGIVSYPMRKRRGLSLASCQPCPGGHSREDPQLQAD